MAPGRPSIAARLGASLRGKVPADEVLALLAATGGAYDDYLAADQLRSELALAGIDAERTSPSESSQLLCTWVAYASVSLAEAFVDAEGVDRARGGFLATVSEQQVLLLLRDVPQWSARARRAAAEPGYDVAAEVRLPVRLPWIAVEPCPRSHLTAMRRAGTVMLEQIEAALADLQRLTQSASPVLTQLRGMAVDAHTRLEYADNLGTAAAVGTMHENVERVLRDGVTACWTLGQVLARPRLAALAQTFPSNPDPRFSDHGPPGSRNAPLWNRPDYGGHDHGHHDHH